MYTWHLIKILIPTWLLVAFTPHIKSAPCDSRAAALIKGFEGYSRGPYKDNGQKSLGYGTSTVRAAKHGFSTTYVSKEDASKLLYACIAEERLALHKAVYGFKDLHPSAQAVLISMRYNCPALIGPKLKAHIAYKRYSAAASEIAYGHDPKGLLGLIRRRAREAQIFSLSTTKEHAFGYHYFKSVDHFNQLKKRNK